MRFDHSSKRLTPIDERAEKICVMIWKFFQVRFCRISGNPALRKRMPQKSRHLIGVKALAAGRPAAFIYTTELGSALCNYISSRLARC